MEMNLVHHSNDRVTLQMIGQFWETRDFSLFQDKVNEYLNLHVKKIVIDLSRVSFVSSQGLGYIVAAFKESKKQGSQFILLHPKGCVKEVIEISGLDLAITIIDSESELPA